MKTCATCKYFIWEDPQGYGECNAMPEGGQTHRNATCSSHKSERTEPIHPVTLADYSRHL